MQIPILKSTHRMLNDKISDLKKDIDGNSKDIGAAAALGDLKENSAYHSAKERQVLLLGKMQRYKGFLNSRVIDLSGSTPEKISFGCAVTVVDTKSGETHLFNLIGPAEYELEVMENMVTIGAPMARLLMGKKVGDIIEARFGSNEWDGEIKEIKAIE